MAQAQLALDAKDLILLNGAIALMMFGASMQIRFADFRRLISNPQAPMIGLFAQFVLLPGATTLLVWGAAIPAEVGLGMILVSCCPGGTFSNIMTWLGRGDLPTSITMTAVSSTAAIVLTPLNFAFYGSLNPHTRALLEEVHIAPLEVLALIAVVLGLPLLLGMLFARRWPQWAKAADRPMRALSLLIFFTLVALAFQRNLGLLREALSLVIPLVIVHNSLALILGAAAAKLAGLSRPQGRAVTMEVGIQNSALGLSLLLTFFPHANGMLLIAACWGIWHLISGLSLAGYWARSAP